MMSSAFLIALRLVIFLIRCRIQHILDFGPPGQCRSQRPPWPNQVNQFSKIIRNSWADNFKYIYCSTFVGSTVLQQLDHRISTWRKGGAIFSPRHTDTSPHICLRLSNGAPSAQVMLVDVSYAHENFGEFGTRCIESRLRIHLVIH